MNETPIWVKAGLGGAAFAEILSMVGCIPEASSNFVPATATVEATATASVIPTNPESRRLGALLENPDLVQTHDFVIRRGLGEIIGINTLQVESNRYEIWVNTEGVKYWIKETKADRLPSFSILTTFNDLSNPPYEASLPLIIYPQYALSVTSIYYLNIAKEARLLLDRGAYQVSPANRVVAEANLVDLIFNTAMIQGFLGGVNVSESIRTIGPNLAVQGRLIRQSQIDASSYQSDLLSGRRPWMVHVKATRTQI